MKKKENEKKITGKEVVRFFSIIGFCIGVFLFGYNVYHHNTPQIVIFLLITLVCAGFFVGSIRSNVKKSND